MTGLTRSPRFSLGVSQCRQAVADRGCEALAARANIGVTPDVTAKLEDLGTCKTQSSVVASTLLRAAMKGGGVVIVAVDEIDDAVRLLRKSNIADKWPGRKLTF